MGVADRSSGLPAGPELRRQLRLRDAVFIGLGSMIGAGVFSVFAPAAAAAGSALVVGLLIAGCVAFCNATSSAQLAAQYPTSGGTYVYAREQLGDTYGYLAGWMFVVGKTASCAAMALTAAAYLAPSGWERLTALGVVALVAAINYRGITRTAFATKAIVGIVGLILLAFLVVVGSSGSPPAGDLGLVGNANWYGVLQSAGLIFFAFAGYARLATLGEEVRDPARTIPRAILWSLAIVILLYAAVAVVVLRQLGPEQLAAAVAPLEAAAQATGSPWLVFPLSVGAGLASIGAMLALFTGISRTSLAMTRNRDLPRWLGAVHPRYSVPHRAELALAVLVAGLVLIGDIRTVIGFSSFGVLLYYFVANLSAFTQTAGDRRYPRFLAVLGALGCAVLAATLPLVSVVAGLGVAAVGLAVSVLSKRLRSADH